MKKFTICALALAAVSGLSAGELDLHSRIMLKRHAIEKAQQNSGFYGLARKATSTTSQDLSAYTLAFASLRDGYTMQDLEDNGLKVLTVRGDIAIVSLKAEDAPALSKLECVKTLSLQRKVKATMDLARAESGIDDIHKGEALGMPYTGKNVFAAIVDEGIDPNHISFKTEDYKNRVKYLSYFDGTANSFGEPVAQYYGEDMVDYDINGNEVPLPTVTRFKYDNLYTYHGTHTLNILGGGYRGDVTMLDDNFNPITVANPYYGAAPEADLAVSCGYLADACIAYGLDGLLDYAYYMRQEKGDYPAVISLSLGASTGAHDPNSFMNRFLTECGKEAIVVIAAGNEGDLKLHADKTLTADDNTFRTGLYPYYKRYDAEAGAPSFSNNWDCNSYLRNDIVYVYGSDNRPFTINAVVMTNTNGIWQKRATLSLNSEEGLYYGANSQWASYVSGSTNSTLGKYFDGYVGGGILYDSDINRYYGAIDFALCTLPETGMDAEGNETAIVALEVVGEDGQRIDCYAAGDNTWLYDYDIEGFTDGSRDGTISDMAIGDNMLVVGAYTLRDNFVSLNGIKYGFDNNDGITVNRIGEYSSFGTLPDGTTLPHVCAPGTAVMSAVSTPYVENMLRSNSEDYVYSDLQAKTVYNDRTYYWKQATGTSMSTPLVAGGIALWLEADPALTINDVKDIIAKTSVKDEDVEAGLPAQWGAGKFDAMAGLKEVIARKGAGVREITGENINDRLLLTPLGSNRYEIVLGGANVIDAKAYNLSGACVYSTQSQGCQAVIDLSDLAKGVYVVNANGHSAKIVVK